VEEEPQFKETFITLTIYGEALKSRNVYTIQFSPATCYFLPLTYLITPWNRVLLEKLTAFCGIRRFITAFTISCSASLLENLSQYSS
jgi:hypothetical protein